MCCIRLCSDYFNDVTASILCLLICRRSMNGIKLAVDYLAEVQITYGPPSRSFVSNSVSSCLKQDPFLRRPFLSLLITQNSL